MLSDAAKGGTKMADVNCINRGAHRNFGAQAALALGQEAPRVTAALGSLAGSCAVFWLHHAPQARYHF